MNRKHPLAECENCPLYRDGSYVPTFNLFPSNRIAIVGEAPGAYEARTGIPFTGPTGKLLNSVLGHYNIQRDETMITNMCACRQGDEAPPKAAVTACRPRLEAELTDGRVKQILAVGKVAVHNLLDTKASMRKLRVGPGKPYPKNESVTVIPTWHPAYCLRSPDSFPDFVTDVEKLVKKDSKTWKEPEYRVLDNPEETVKALHKLYDRGYHDWVIDIEVGVDKDESFIHPSEYRMLCLGIAFAPGLAVVIGENAINSEEVSVALKELMPLVRLIAHNGKFDLAGLRRITDKQSLYFDTMLASYSLEERPGHHGLKALSIERLGAPDYEADIRDYVPRGGNYADIPRDVLYKYNAYDVVCTWYLYRLFVDELSVYDRAKHDFLIKASNALIEFELEGIYFDSIYSKEVETKMLEEIGVIEQEMEALLGRSINPRSVPQVQTFYQENGLILPTTGADFLKELLDKIEGTPQEFTKLLLHHRKQSKLYGTFVKGLARRVYEDKVYTTYMLHSTTSGRLSSRAPNLQNVTREKLIRNQFTARNEDYVLFQLDYSQAEGRVITFLSQEEYLAEIFRDPSRDIFAELCNDIFGIGKWGKEQRVTIKSIFYGNAYGRKALSICKALQLQGSTISLEETQSLMNDFNALIPNVIKWQNSIKRKVLNGESLATPFGRKRSFWLITDRNRTDVLNEALSYLPQSIASDICLRALINVQPKLLDLATLRLTVHDALIAECHRDDLVEASEIVKYEMLKSAEQYTTYIPFKVDLSYAYRWGDFK